MVPGVAVSEHRSEIGDMVTEQLEGLDGVGRVRISMDAPELLPDLSLLLLELVDHLLHEKRVNPGGDGSKLRMLFCLYASKPRLQVRSSLEDLFAVPPQQPLLMPLQRTQSSRIEKFSFEGAHDLGLDLVVAEPQLADRALPVPDGWGPRAETVYRPHPPPAPAED